MYGSLNKRKPGKVPAAAMRWAVATTVLFTLVASAAGAASGGAIIVFAIGDSNYIVNGELLTMDTTPMVVEGRTLLPIRYAAEPLGAAVGWDPDTSKATVALDSVNMELWIGKNQALLNGQLVPIDPDNPNVKPLLINGRTMLPLRFVTEALGCSVHWDAKDQIATIIKAGAEGQEAEIPEVVTKPGALGSLFERLGSSTLESSLRDTLLEQLKPTPFFPGKPMPTDSEEDKELPDIKIPDPVTPPDVIPGWNVIDQFKDVGLTEEAVAVDSTSYYEDYYGTALTADSDMLTAGSDAYKWGITNVKKMNLQYFSFYLKPEGKYDRLRASFYLDGDTKDDVVLIVRKESRDGMVIKSLTLKPGETIQNLTINIAGVNKLSLEAEIRINHGVVEKLIVGEPVFVKAK